MSRWKDTAFLELDRRGQSLADFSLGAIAALSRSHPQCAVYLVRQIEYRWHYHGNTSMTCNICKEYARQDMSAGQDQHQRHELTLLCHRLSEKFVAYLEPHCARMWSRSFDSRSMARGR